MHVQRVVAGQRTAISYKELKVEEFVLGFLIMLDSPRGKWDKEVMLEILKMLLQDTVDFDWENARNFYLMVGLYVEAGVRRWTDMEAIRQQRIIHSRTVYQEKKESKESKKGNGGKTQLGTCVVVLCIRNVLVNRIEIISHSRTLAVTALRPQGWLIGTPRKTAFEKP